MKLIGSLAAVAVAHAQMAQLDSMNAGSDECAGCNPPEKKTECVNPPCDNSRCGRMEVFLDGCDGDRCKVDCDLEHGYYADNSNCRGYCFCSGHDNVDTGTGERVPSRYELCPVGTVWDKSCKGYHSELQNGFGYDGGCCVPPWRVLNFAKSCKGACERLGKHHCDKSVTCSWDADCKCCRSGPPAVPTYPPREECLAQKLDITFIVDSSGSIGNVWFEKTVQFLGQLAQRLDISEEGTHVACVEYATLPTVEFGYTSDRDTVLDNIAALPFIGKSTQTGKAMNLAATDVVPTGREGVPSVVFVFTDGVSYDKAAADKIDKRGPELQEDSIVFALGVNGADQVQLDHIASDPSDYFVEFIKDWNDAFGADVVDRITQKLCDYQNQVFEESNEE